MPLWAAKTGPFTNPSETYEFYSLPYCKPKDGVRWKTLGMGEVVDANRMASTPYDLSFRVERANQTVCRKTLTEEEVERFRDVRGRETERGREGGGEGETRREGWG